MPNFIETFGELGPDGEYFLSSSRQSIITPVHYHVPPLSWVSTLSSSFVATSLSPYFLIRTFFGGLGLSSRQIALDVERPSWAGRLCLPLG